ncbi:hypothetical protein ANMWB30_13000 [Arthrobacter sp. MWB30]|nr:hypothetical protein ANMWB30_13000 [Arthrobacter sp. MWB30]
MPVLGWPKGPLKSPIQFSADPGGTLPPLKQIHERGAVT